MTFGALSKSDFIGAAASGLCLVHCIATPFLFIAQSCSATACCASGPAWWSAIDYLFIFITFFAIRQSIRKTTKPRLKYTFYTLWVLLTLFILDEKFGLVGFSHLFKYIAAFGLIGLHLYNLKYCTCEEEACLSN